MNMRLQATLCLVAAGLLVSAGIAAAQPATYRYLVTDPMIGTQTTDLNTVFWRWEGIQGCQTPIAAVDATGLTLSGDLSTLGLHGGDISTLGRPDWVFRGNFRITISVTIQSGRVHFSLAEYTTQTTNTISRAHGITGNLTTHGDGFVAEFVGSAYFLIKKDGALLSIHQGNQVGVDDSSPIVASGLLGPGEEVHFFAAYSQTGCSSEGGTIRLKDFRLEAEEILPNGSSLPTVPEEWKVVNTVLIDIKPGSFPNSINLGASGTIPIAVLSRPGFNAPAEVDPASLNFAGAAVRIIGKSSRYQCSNEDVNGDGELDLVCQFNHHELTAQPGDSVGVLEGQTYGGTRIRGEDSIRIVP